MRQIISSIFKIIPTILEIIISIMLAAGIVLTCIKLCLSMGNINDLNVWPNYNDLIETCLNLIIGVELINMIYIHTVNKVFEVLIFALARQIIINHSGIWVTLVGIVAIAILFATKKYLFTEFDGPEPVAIMPKMKARIANKVFKVRIPYEKPSDTVLDVFNRYCEESEMEVCEGAEIFFENFGLRALKLKNDQVSKMELIRISGESIK